MKELQELMNEIQEWTGKMFGEGKSRIVPNLKHLQKEIPELIESYEEYGECKHTDLEYADAFILLLQSASRYGLTAERIVEICNKKLEINKMRSWGKPDKDGVVEHIRKT